MTELSGTLDGVGLPAIVRFLAGLHKTGALRITHQDWHGELVFDNGRVVSAQLGSRTGLKALDALLQTLPGGSFVFDPNATIMGSPNVDLTPDALLAHLDELAERTDTGGPVLPSLESVPHLVPQADDGRDQEDTVPLDRGTLQTLLSVDGVRSVRDIIAARGSFEALWQIADLNEAGLVRLSPPPALSAPPATPTPEPVPATTIIAAAPEPSTVEVPPTAEVPPTVEVPAAADATATVGAAPATCPKLGFEDDPGSSFARPTRLHRCFAAGAPLPLSLDQQRELCLSEQYGTCPRLAMAGPPPAAPRPAPVEAPLPTTTTVPDVPVAPATPNGRPSPAPRPLNAPTRVDDPRIVRLPIGGRMRPAARVAPAAAEPTADAAPPPAPPTPLRARIVRPSIAASATATAAAPLRVPKPASAAEPTVQFAPPVAPPPRPTAPSSPPSAEPPRRLPFGSLPLTNLPLTAIAAVVLVLLALGAAALLLPNLMNDEQNVDLSSLPNASAVAAGTPVAELAIPKPTAASAAPDSTAADAPSDQRADAAVATVPQAPPTVEPTAVPTPSGPRTVLDEAFEDNGRGWPNNPQGPAWVTGGTLRLSPRQANQFVAVAVPTVSEIPQDVVVSGTFRKVGGPAGGGYGFLVRDQGPGPRDGLNQAGRYYVLEVGDKGEVGIWRREGDRWIDLLPWQRADAVRPGNASNEITVRAIGDRLSLIVNGTEVGTRTDDTLALGNIGVFVGGDGNQVALENLTVQTPS